MPQLRQNGPFDPNIAPSYDRNFVLSSLYTRREASPRGNPSDCDHALAAAHQPLPLAMITICRRLVRWRAALVVATQYLFPPYPVSYDRSRLTCSRVHESYRTISGGSYRILAFLFV